MTTARTRHVGYGIWLIIAAVLGWWAAFQLTIEKFYVLENPGETTSCYVSVMLQCDKNLGSWQGAVFGFPNPLIGVTAWMAVLVMGVAVLSGVRFPRWFWGLFGVGVLGAFIFVCWLIGQSIYSLHTLCPWCMATWAVTIPPFFATTLHLVRNGTLGRLDPRDGSVRVVQLGENAAPHGVIRGPDGAAWVTEGGQNAIARVDPASHKVELFRLPESRANANLNTGVFDPAGNLWFTGQNGIYGRLDPRSAKMEIWDAPRGRGAYGITLTPSGEVWYASLAGNHIARIDTATGVATILEPPTPGQGARRIWSDSRSRLWVSEWNSGNVSMYDTAARSWRVWKLPGEKPRA